MASLLKSVNPFTEEVIYEFLMDHSLQVESKLTLCSQAQKRWKLTSHSLRADSLLRLAAELESQKKGLAATITLEMGKPLSQSLLEIEKCVSVCRYYAEKGEEFLSPQAQQTKDSKHWVQYEPLGIVFMIMPWNFPFWQCFRVLVPQLFLGNGVVLKHASNVTACALEIQKLVHIALQDFAELFQVVILPGAQADQVIRDPRISAVTLTGSEDAGRSVAKIAGENLKKSVLELGGSDPYLVFEDADLEKAAELCVTSRLLNTGQSCIAAKRFIVIESIFDEFLHLFTENLKKRTLGNPMESPDMGPLAKKEFGDDLNELCHKGEATGAHLHFAGEEKWGGGFFFPPKIYLVNGTENILMKAETFGPVAALMRVKDERQALQVANQSSFGLGSAIFTRNEARARFFSRELMAGSVSINDYVKSDPRFPFGGVKNSGFGRELGPQGLMEFANVKTVAWNL